jgi:hypothetical protein
VRHQCEKDTRVGRASAKDWQRGDTRTGDKPDTP